MTYEEAQKLSDHDLLPLLKDGEDVAWKRVWFEVIEPEKKRQRNAELMRKWSVTDGDLFGILYKEMIGDGKLANYRDDGGSLMGWMRAYVRGYITRSDPAPHGEFSLEGTAELDERGEQMAIPVHDNKSLLNEVFHHAEV